MASFCVTRLSLLCAFLAVLLKLSHGQNAGGSYRGRLIGALMSKKHNVSGEVYAVDSRTLHIRSFTYDGTAPDAFFWTGFTDQPSPQGIIIPNERGTKEVLVAYNNQDVTISLPDGLTLRDVKWFAVWCRAYEVNFGDVYIPANLDFPQAHVVGSIVGQHGVSSGPIVVVDAQTILVPDFTYDGQSPDLHFWVGRGVPGPNGIRVPDETGTDAPLQKADKKTMVLSLPGDLTVFDIDYFGVYGRLYSTDFGHVRITPGLNVPPSLRMLGVAPQLPLHPTQPNHLQYIQPIQPVHTGAIQHIITPGDAVTPISIPQQQYFMIVEDGSQAVDGTAGTATIYAEPTAPPVIEGGVVYNNAPLTAAATTTLTSTQGGHVLGSNGFSTFTLRTSKGSSTSEVLY